MYTQTCLLEIFLLLALGTRAYVGCPLSPLMMQVASMPLSLVSTQAPLISRSTHSVKLMT